MAIIIATHMITAARRYGSASDGRIISHISRTIGPVAGHRRHGRLAADEEHPGDRADRDESAEGEEPLDLIGRAVCDSRWASSPSAA